MTDKLKKFLEKHEINVNQNKPLDSENNEINFELTTYENKNLQNQENNNITEENEITTENRENNYIEPKNEEENENNDIINNEHPSDNEEESNELIDELPLITLNFISVCQCCKNRFNKEKYIPYLLKCGHFFCLNCIKQYFSDETGIVCPSDGPVAKSVKELKLLKNLIINPNKPKKKENKKKIENKNKYYENSDYYKYMKSNLENYNNENNSNYKMNYCRIHKNQKLTHIICDTNEIICVHCAFEMLKLNPSMQIKELKEKYNELSDFIDEIMNSSQKNVDLIQNTIELIKKNKENEQKKIKKFYNNLIKYLENEKKEGIQKIENISKDNIHNLEQKLLIFNEIIEQGEEFQSNLEKEDGDINQNYSSVINNYNNILKLNQSNHADKATNKLKYIKFISKNENHIKEYLNKTANINIINRIIRYNKNLKSKIDNNTFQSLRKPSNNYSKNTNDASSIRYHKRIVKNQFNKKNISSENLNDKISQNDSSEYYNFNSSVKVRNSDYFIKNNFNNSTFDQSKKSYMAKTLKIGSKTPVLNQNLNQKYIFNKSIKNKNRSLLENYFNLKNQNKNDNSEKPNINYFLNEHSGSIPSQKNNKSFNNLNILNNFYNLDYSRRSPNNIDINKKGYVNIAQMKLYKDSLNKLIPNQLKQINFE